MVRAIRALRLAVATLIVALATAVGAGTAGACECVAIDDPTAFERASVVFLGDLIDVSPGDPTGDELSTTLSFAVVEVYKGDAVAQEVVTTPVSGGECGVAFERPTRYLVFATGGAGSLEITACGGSRVATTAPEAWTPRPPSTQVDAAAEDGAIGESARSDDVEAGSGWSGPDLAVAIVLLATAVVVVGAAIRSGVRSPQASP